MGQNNRSWDRKGWAEPLRVPRLTCAPLLPQLLSCCCDKMSSKSYLKKKEPLLWLVVSGLVVRHGRGGRAAGAEGDWSHCIRSGNTEMTAGTQLTLSLSTLGLQPWNCLYLRWASSTSINPYWIILYAWRSVSMVILNPIKLTIKMNRHTPRLS